MIIVIVSLGDPEGDSLAEPISYSQPTLNPLSIRSQPITEYLAQLLATPLFRQLAQQSGNFCLMREGKPDRSPSPHPGRGDGVRG